MWEQEKVHLATFEQLLTMYRVRPTVFLPLWDILGYSLGYATASMGKESAMACTVAVEESITEHYNDQIRELLIRDPEERYYEIYNYLRQKSYRQNITLDTYSFVGSFYNRAESYTLK